MPDTEARAPLLTLRGMRIAAGRATLIDQFDLRLAAGEAAALVGPPGCGKSLLLRVAAGLEPPAAGERSIAPCRSAFVFQRGGLIRNITVEENLLLPLYYQGATPAGARKRVAAALEDFGLAAVADRRPGDLLEETRLLAQFARAAALAADLLFLDEPFPQLSRPSAARVEQWLKSEVAASKLAVLMTGAERQALPRMPIRCLELSAPAGEPARPDGTAFGVAPP